MPTSYEYLPIRNDFATTREGRGWVVKVLMSSAHVGEQSVRIKYKTRGYHYPVVGKVSVIFGCVFVKDRRYKENT